MGADKMRYLRNVVLFLVMFLFCGCQLIDEPIEVMRMPRMGVGSGTVVAADRTMERRFGGTESQADDAAESALAMSKKYQELSLEMEKLRQENVTVKLENDSLTRQTAGLESQLETTRNELSEANEFLQQMHVELGKWKSDVLGYRDEMRSAQVAELEALKKILKILGAELTEPLKQTQVAKEG
jgi:chromosome segregation ATPase